jgi:hypothetical protein
VSGGRNSEREIALRANDETHGMRHPMRYLKASISGSVARETATHVTS